MVTDKSIASRLLDTVIYVVLIVCSVSAVLPILYIVAGSLAAPSEWAKGFVLVPTKLSLQSYEFIFSTGTIVRALLVSASITVAGTLFYLGISVLTAYPLAQRDLQFRGVLLFLVVFTMMFDGGLIPKFLVVKAVGLLDSYASVIIPGALSAFSLIIFKTFFQNIPYELKEAARIDGCHELVVLTRIMIPLSGPILATFTIIFGVAHWNAWFDAVLYISDPSKWPVQTVLKQVIASSKAGSLGDSSAMQEEFVFIPNSVKMATITVATLPILLIYPLLQKHFMKGLYLGSVKG
ncbi:carbohydrate ABC transporter permease [Paenibacillus koleovorans]|uniref:carbohydrate ABC transporter permease n=1 Tax=Paenibacillus koleovorans TaxID=121608 RepID=UPI000FD97D64|nr:carbohydrate ABC transporter permease [Paenibacillus koleovorans]